MASESGARAVEVPTPSHGPTTRRVARSLIGGITATLLGAVLLGAAAKAEDLPFGTPGVAYAGVAVTEAGGRMTRNRVFYTPGYQRTEMYLGGTQQVMLVDFDAEVSYMIMPQMKSYMALPQGAGSAGMPGADPLDEPGAEIAYEAVGEETIDGRATTKYRFAVTAPDATTEGFAWVTAEGIVLRSESETTGGTPGQVPGRVAVRLEDLVIGPQDPALFELPAGFRQIGAN